MNRDDRDDPFDDIFRQIERMMNNMIDQGNFDGNVNVGPGGGSAGGGSDTHVDVHETDEEVRVVADLPGVEKGDIDLKCDGQVLTIGAHGDRRTYNERIDLPSRVDEHSASATFNNGVLEVVLEPAEDSASIDLG